jgi:uncharacterized protein YxjI
VNVLLNRRHYFVKERVAFVKLTDTYDILDAESGTPIGIAREEPPGWAKFLRLAVNKQFLPTAVNVYEGTGEDGTAPVVTLRKGPALLRSKVTVSNGRGVPLGRFDSKIFSLGGGFFVCDAQGNRVAEVKGDWKGWNFRFLDAAGNELGVVTKKWAGLGKELFTSADNYMIALSDSAPANPDTAALLLAAGLAIDVVFKENKG